MNKRYIAAIFSIILLLGGFLLNKKYQTQSLKDPIEKRLSLNDISELKKSVETQLASADSARIVSADSSPAGFGRNLVERQQLVSESEMRMLIENDDICKSITVGPTLEVGVLSLVKAPDRIRVDAEQDRLLEEIFGARYQSQQNLSAESNLILDFYNALLFANLIAGIKNNPYVNYEKADRILADLENRDPANGVYAYMRAFVLSKLNADQSRVKEEFLKSFKAEKFDTFLTTISRRIYEKSFSSAVYHNLGLNVLTTMSIPDINSSYFLLKELLKTSGQDFNYAAIQFGQRLMQPGLQADGKYEFLHWMAIEFSVGELITDRARAYPAEYTGKYKKSYRALVEKGSKNRINFEPVISALAGNTDCKRDLYDRLLKKDEQQYLEFLKHWQTKYINQVERE